MKARIAFAAACGSMALGLVGMTAAPGRIAKPVPLPTIPPVVVEDLDDIEAMEAVINIYFQQTLYGTGDESLAFEAAFSVLGVIEAHFYSGSPNALVVHFPALPPPQLALSAGSAGETCPAQTRGEFLLGDDGDWLSLDQEFSSFNPETGESNSGGRFSLGRLGGDWTKGYTPNDPLDPGAGGLGTWGAYPDFADCLDFGGNFGLMGSHYDYGDGGPGESTLTVGWTWGIGS